MGPGGNGEMGGMPRMNGTMGGMPGGMGGEGSMGPRGPLGEEGQGPMNSRAGRPQSAPAEGGIDVVLEDVELAGEATLVAGPAYAVRFRNQGLQSTGKFVVLVAASLDGRLAQDAPKAVIEVPGIEGGKGIELMLRLPKTALQMNEGKGFSHLIVMVDAKNSLVESDKSNNGAVLERAALESAQSPAAQGPAIEGPLAQGPVAQGPAAQEAPSGLGVMGQLPQ
jgi:hypothetical protein